MGSDGGLMVIGFSSANGWGLNQQQWLENPAVNGGFYPRLPPKGDAQNISKQ